jgi:hypothetical protein
MTSVFGCQTTDLKSSFEKGKIDQIWSVKKIADGAAKIQSKVVRDGKFAIELTLHKGMTAGVGANNKNTERTELKTKSKYQAVFGQDYWYQFSFYLPEDFPMENNRLVIGQWKQVGAKSPLIAQRISKGHFQITTATDGRGKEIAYSDAKDIRHLTGKWIDMLYRINYSAGDDGRLQVWMNKEKIVDQIRQLGNPGDVEKVYFKFGLYRDESDSKMKIYFDRYRRTNTSPCVVPRHPGAKKSNIHTHEHENPSSLNTWSEYFSESRFNDPKMLP